MASVFSWKCLPHIRVWPALRLLASVSLSCHSSLCSFISLQKLRLPYHFKRRAALDLIALIGCSLLYYDNKLQWWCLIFLCMRICICTCIATVQRKLLFPFTTYGGTSSANPIGEDWWKTTLSLSPSYDNRLWTKSFIYDWSTMCYFNEIPFTYLLLILTNSSRFS